MLWGRFRKSFKLYRKYFMKEELKIFIETKSLIEKITE